MLRFMMTTALLLVCAVSVWADDVVAPGAKVEKVTDGFRLCDGPAWDGKADLYFPDVKAEKLLRYNVDDGKVHTVIDAAGRISATMFDMKGRLHLSDNGNARITRLDNLRSEKVTVLAQLPADVKPPHKPNDLCVDKRGGIYVTVTAANQVAYITPDGKLATAIENIDRPNGLILSPDDKTLYVAAFTAKQIWAYDVQAGGKVTNGRHIASMDDGPDRGADGMTVDARGNIYCAGPQHIWVWNRGGKLVTKIEVPQKPINCGFGDKDYKTLYITAGPTLYRIRMNVKGGR